MTGPAQAHPSERRERLVLRASIVQAARRYFVEQGFLEVFTPLLSDCVIPEEHIDIIESECGFLLPSPEIRMKPMLASGCGDIFQIGPAFRKGERGEHHLTEFTLLEWYRPGADYHALMADCEGLFGLIQEEVFPGRPLTYRGTPLDLTPPWRQLTVREAFGDYAGWDPTLDAAPDRFEQDLVEKVVPYLDRGRPVFLMDFPDYEASLARRKPEDSRLAERVELFLGGLEIANGFSELTDPGEQRARFLLANRHREQRGSRSYPMPDGFLASLEQMPASAGMALGVDRMVMLFTDAARIEEVIAM